MPKTQSFEFITTVSVTVPDDFCDRVRQLQAELGPNYLPENPTDDEILSRVAEIRGMRRFGRDEALDQELNEQVEIEIDYDSW